MKSLDEVRAEIDEIDRELVPLIVRRLEAVCDVAEVKRATGKPVHDPVREKVILDDVAKAAGAEFGDEAKTVFETLFDVTKCRQRARLANTVRAGDLSVAVVGLGLIGGSFQKASLRAGYSVAGLHHGETEGLAAADIVLVCLPPEAIVPWIRGNANSFKKGAAVVDIAGTKADIVREMGYVPRDGWTFVGGHPMAGKEVTGFANSTADLFLGKSMVLTPEGGDWSQRNGDRAVLEQFFLSLGFTRVVVTSPERHDELIAFTSQLGHVIASAYAQDPLVAESVGFSAGSYANMSRIATVDPETWASLYLSDRKALLRVLDGFIGRLGDFRAALEGRDADALRRFIAAGAAAKRAELAKANQPPERRHCREAQISRERKESGK